MDTEKILIIFALLINSIDNYEVLMYYINKQCKKYKYLCNVGIKEAVDY